MQMLEALQSAEAAGKAPPGSYDAAVGRLQSEFEYSGSPPGQSANEGFTGDWTADFKPVEAPWGGDDSNFRRGQHMAHSLAEDAMLREQLGHSYKLPKDHGIPEGVYAASDYPGLETALQRADTGMGPVGMAASYFSMNPKQQREWVRKNKEWAKTQRKMLGKGRIEGDEWRSFRRGMKGRGAKQRREAMRGFLRGI